jgi:hypothetical protein
MRQATHRMEHPGRSARNPGGPHGPAAGPFGLPLHTWVLSLLLLMALGNVLPARCRRPVEGRTTWGGLSEDARSLNGSWRNRRGSAVTAPVVIVRELPQDREAVSADRQGTRSSRRAAARTRALRGPVPAGSRSRSTRRASSPPETEEPPCSGSPLHAGAAGEEDEALLGQAQTGALVGETTAQKDPAARRSDPASPVTPGMPPSREGDRADSEDLPPCHRVGAPGPGRDAPGGE